MTATRYGDVTVARRRSARWTQEPITRASPPKLVLVAICRRDPGTGRVALLATKPRRTTSAVAARRTTR